MRRFVCVHDKEMIEAFARRDVYLNLYLLGDLDPFFWPHTQWYGVGENGCLDALACLYVGQSLPTLLAFSKHPDTTCRLLEQVSHLLPNRFYAHLSPGIDEALSDGFELEVASESVKMALTDDAIVHKYADGETVRLGPSDLGEAQNFFDES